MLDEPILWLFRALASVLCACFFFAATEKLPSALQQSGYENKKFLRWLFQERNTYFSRLIFLSVLTVSATALFIFVFFFLGQTAAMAMGAIPFFGFAILFTLIDKKFALKVQATRSSRWQRLSVAYCVSIALTAFVLIFLCSLLGLLIEAVAFGWLCAICFLPLCFMPILLPFCLTFANFVLTPFERKHNEKYVKRAGQVLDERDIIKIGIVGSYGKTSVKNILKTILSTRFNVIATPASYNTPMGVAKTVFEENFSDAEVFLVEMGARHLGDITQLCDLVKPDYVAFTGVCAQHIQTFGTEENVFKAKCEALTSSAKRIVCGRELRERIQTAYPSEAQKCLFVGEAEGLVLNATKTSFSVPLDSQGVLYEKVEIPLLGEGAAENVLLAVEIAKLMGLSAQEILLGIAKIAPIPHRLQLMEKNGVYILDDAYNCNIRGAKMAVEALKRFDGKRYLVTPGIVETGVLQTEINGQLGKLLAEADLDLVILVGETQAKVILDGFNSAEGNRDKIKLAPSIERAVELLQGNLRAGDCVLFMNDLPDVV